MKSYAVIGLGRFGRQMASKLYEYGENVMAIDTDQKLVNDISDKVTKAIIANAKDPDVLKKIGFKNIDCAIVAVGSDLASSVLITMNLKNLGVPLVICKAQDEMHLEILKKLGADKVIIPERDVADKIAQSLSNPNILEYIELSDDYGIMDVLVPEEWLGKTIRESNIRAKYSVNIIGIKSGDDIIVSPDPDRKMMKGEYLMILGEYENLDRIKNI